MSMLIYFYLDKYFIIYFIIIIILFIFLFFIYLFIIHPFFIFYYFFFILLFIILFFLLFATHWFTILLSEEEKITWGIITAEGKKNFLGTSARDNADPAEDID